jgi:predicted nucleic acid-binding protein
VVDLGSVVRHHGRVGLDTPVFVYQIERVAPFDAVAHQVLLQLRQGAATGVTSVLTFAELLVRPLRLGRRGLAARYEALVRATPNLTVVDINGGIARRAAALRAAYNLRTPDALQLAAAIEGGATAFVTNDRRLRRVEELDLIVLDDYLDR